MGRKVLKLSGRVVGLQLPERRVHLDARARVVAGLGHEPQSNRVGLELELPGEGQVDGELHNLQQVRGMGVSGYIHVIGVVCIPI